MKLHLYLASALLFITSSYGQTPRPAPQITGISPARAAAGDTITVAGTAFGEYVQGVSSVRLGRCPSEPQAPGPGLLDVPPQNITSWADTEIKVVLPPRSLGFVAIVRGDGQMSNRGEFEVVSPCPGPASLLTSLDPSSIAAGSADTAVILTGSNFTTDAVVKSDGTAVATTYQSSTSLRAVLPASLLRETRTLLITVSNAEGSSALLPLAVTPQRPAAAAIVNAASLLAGAVAPGEIVTLFGSGLGPLAPAALKLDESGRVARVLQETRVWFDEMPAPLTYASEGQVNAIVPFGLAGKTRTRLAVEYHGLRSEPVLLDVAPAAPGIFTMDGSGRGRGAILNQDGTLNSAAAPASPGSIIVFYATGAGQTNPIPLDGTLTVSPWPQPAQVVDVRIGGLPAEVLYAGAAPDLVAGLLQINARIPRDLAGGGPTPVFVFVGGAATQPGVMLEVAPR